MKLSIYQAECGDAACLQFTGSDHKLHHVMIDAGFVRTFRNIISSEIKSIAAIDHLIDLWIISHIHDDHIGGAIAYCKRIRDGALPDVVNKWMYNSPRGLVTLSGTRGNPISSARSIAQGDELANDLLSLNKLPAEEITNEVDCQNLYGLKMTFLSPDKAAMEALRMKYAPERNLPLEREEKPEISNAKTASQNDYSILLKDFNLRNTSEDNSIENGSSISILFELHNKKLLWLSDPHPTIVTRTLRKMGYSEANNLKCEWVKVAHHGSKENNSLELYNLIQCNNFLISANGNNKYKLPSKECLARIIQSSQRTPSVCNLYFTYDNPTIRSIFLVDGDKTFRDLNFAVHYFSKPVTIFEV